MSTANKLDYISETKNRLKTVANYAEAGISADTFRSYPEKIYNSYIDIINGDVDIKTDMPKLASSNTNIDLTNAIDKPFTDFNLEGNTQQDSTIGKNLYDVGMLATKTDAGITFTPVYKNGMLQYINLNGTASANIFYNFKKLTFQAGTYILSGSSSNLYSVCINFGSGRISQGNETKTFTLTETKTMTESFIRVTDGTQINNVKIYPMIRLSSISDSSYEPYTGGMPSPNPDYSQPINVVTGRNDMGWCGKNLFDKSKAIDNYRITQEGTPYSDNNYYISPYIKVIPNTQYTKNSPTADAYHRYAFYQETNTSSFISVSSDNTITTPNNCNYIRFCGAKTEKDTAVVELGNSSGEYEPYIGYIQEINLGKNLLNLNRTEETYTSGILFSNTKYYKNMARDSGVGSNISATISDNQIIVNGRYNQGIGYPIQVKPNTTYTIKVNSNDSNARMFYNLWDSNSSYISNCNDTTDKVRTLTTPSNARWLVVILAVYGSSLTNVTFTNLQVEAGNQATSYNSYFEQIELCKIGTYQDFIRKGTGKNLFDKNITPEDYFYNNSGIKESTDDPCINQEINNINFSSIYISFSSKTGTPYVRVCEYNSSGTFIKRTLVSTKQTLALDSNTKKLIFSVNASSINNFTNLMIEKGNQATSYEPYGFKDKWYLHKEIGSVTLNGTENWIWRNSGDGTNTVSFTMLMNFKAYGDNSSYCDNFTYEQTSSSGKEGIGISSNLTEFYIQIKRERLSDISTQTAAINSFKTWLSNYNTKFYYTLAYPTYIEITNLELISQLNNLINTPLLKGLNHITVSTENEQPTLSIETIKDYNTLWSN